MSHLNNLDKAKLVAGSQRASAKLLGTANTLKLDKKLAAGARVASSHWDDATSNFADSVAERFGHSHKGIKVQYFILGVVAGVVIIKLLKSRKNSKVDSYKVHDVTEKVRDGLHQAREKVSEASQDLGNSIQEVSHRHSSAVKDAIGHEDKVNAVSQFNETAAEKAKNLADKADEKSHEIIEDGSEAAHENVEKEKKKHKHKDD